MGLRQFVYCSLPVGGQRYGVADWTPSRSLEVLYLCTSVYPLVLGLLRSRLRLPPR